MTFELSNLKLEEFVEKQRFLLIHGINERTIVHKLAEHIAMQDIFSGYDIDCEYNRMLGDGSDGHFVAKKLHLDVVSIDSTDEEGTTVFPDIIVHKRGKNDRNLLIIEVKKKNFADKKTADGTSFRDFDLRKIRAYMEQLGYSHGLYLEFNGIEFSSRVF